MSDAMDEMLADAADAGADLADDEVEIDLSEAETYEPFTAKVPVEIVSATLEHGNDSKLPYLNLKLRVCEGEHEGRVMFTNVMLKGKGAGIGYDKLGAFGATSADGVAVSRDNPKISLTRLEGLRAVADCAPDTRDGYTHKVVVGRISKYVSADAVEAEALK